MMRFLTLFVVAILSFMEMHAQCWPQLQKLIPEADTILTENFGNTLDQDGDILVVGSSTADTLGFRAGIVYVFQFTGNSWKKIAKLYPSDYGADQNFGQNVRIDGNTVVVGDPAGNEPGSRGVVYVFEKPVSGWIDMTETHRLLPEDPEFRGFGYSVDIRGDYLIVGAPGTMTAQLDYVGAAVIYKRQAAGWSSVATLRNVPGRESTFGESVALQDDFAVVTNPSETTGLSSEFGVTYVFNKPASEWADSYPSARLTVDVPGRVGGTSGNSIATDGNTIFITDNRATMGPYYISAFYVYERPAGGWTDAIQSSYFFDTAVGHFTYHLPIVLDGDYVFFGNDGTEIKVFKKDPVTNWSQLDPIATITSPLVDDRALFGTAMAVGNDRLIVSMIGYADTGGRDNVYDPEAARIFEFTKPAGGWSESISDEARSLQQLPVSGSGAVYANSLAVDGDYAVVGAHGDKSRGIYSGVAYVYKLNGTHWDQVAQLSASDGMPYDNFGVKVAIDGDYIVIAAPFKERYDNNGNVSYSQGAVYVYKKPSGGWKNMKETFKITANDLGSSPCFGRSVAIEFPYIAVGQYTNSSSDDLGTVFVYKINGTSYQRVARLTPKAQDPGQGFGMALKMDNGVIVAGGRVLRISFIQSNSLYVFQKPADGDWVDANESALLVPSANSPTGYTAGLFGYSFDVSDDMIIVGAPSSTNNSTVYKGAAYLFEKPAAGWTGVLNENAILMTDDDIAYGIAGGSVYIEDRFAVVGAPRNSISTYGGENEGLGKVYFYQRPADGWKNATPDKVLEGDDNHDLDYFGSSVDAVHGYLFVGGSLDDNASGIDAGSVYIYSEYPFIENTSFTICKNEAPVTLKAFPPGGVWSGPGIVDPVNGIFDPVHGGLRNTISYRVDDCDAANTIVIRVIDPVPAFSINTQDSIFFCGKDSIRLTAAVSGFRMTYQWSYAPQLPVFADIGEGGKVSEYYAEQAGYYLLTISNQCSVEKDTVWVGDLVVEAGPDFEKCFDDVVVALTGMPEGGLWSGPGLTDAGFLPSLGGIGRHELVYSVSPVAGCFYRDTISVNVIGVPGELSITATDRFCYEGFADLFATHFPNATYQWFFSSDGSLYDLVSDVNPFRATKLGFYKVVASDGLCSKQSVFEIVPEFSLKYEPVGALSMCYGTTVSGSIIDALYGATYQWFIKTEDGSYTEAPGDGTAGSYLFPYSGTYKVEVENQGCFFSSNDIVYKRIGLDSIFVPNVVTANNDGANDLMDITVLEGEVTLFELQVYNRYGKQVYQSNTLSWDPQGVSSGVYFWTFTYFSHCQQSMVALKGIVSVFKTD